MSTETPFPPAASDAEKEQTRLWLTLMRVHSTVFAALNSALLAEAGLSLAKFDTLAQLYRFRDGISMGALSGALKVSNGNVSGMINRLIRDDLVRKDMQIDDRRSFKATLTDKGVQRFEQALKVHQAMLSEIFSRMPPDELKAASATLRDLSVQLSDASGGAR